MQDDAAQGIRVGSHAVLALDVKILAVSLAEARCGTVVRCVVRYAVAEGGGAEMRGGLAARGRFNPFDITRVALSVGLGADI